MIAAVRTLARQSMWSAANYFSMSYPLSYPLFQKAGIREASMKVPCEAKFILHCPLHP